MSKKLFFTGIFLSSILGGLVVFLLVDNFGRGSDTRRNYINISDRQRMVNTSAPVQVAVPEGLNFLKAADKVLPAVVQIQSTYGGVSSNPIDRMMGREAASTGSGVIITDDGYIATNFHVVDDASKILVTLNNNREFEAQVIGTDETTDLALLKIEQNGLEFLKYGNSDNVKPGEWVLAVGNPFNLYSTVTAGIVSAKARNINILRTESNLQIESFIQTDAVVNPGNSGGALVNLEGELIGINTAIATRSGIFEGYSFAVPVLLVEKVMNDLLEFGEVKRGLLGISIVSVNAELAERNELDIYSGVYVNSVTKNGAGNAAGIQSGDIIIGIGDHDVTNTSELQEFVARNRPGDDITVKLIRENEKITLKATLRDINGSTNIYDTAPSWNNVYFQEVEFSGENELSIGIRVQRNENESWKEAGIENGFIITHIDGQPLNSTEDLIRQLSTKDDGYTIRGIDLYGHTKIIQID